MGIGAGEKSAATTEARTARVEKRVKERILKEKGVVVLGRVEREKEAREGEGRLKECRRVGKGERRGKGRGEAASSQC